MADDRDDSGDDDAGLENSDHDDGDHAVPKWAKAGTWCCALLVGLPVLYFVVYPVLAILIYNALGQPSPIPAMLERSVVPIDWVADRNEFYQNYMEWLGDLLH